MQYNRIQGDDYMTRAITVRVDDTTKKQAEAMLEELGLNMTTYVNSSLKALVREKRVPFELSITQKNNSDYLSKLEHSIAQVERGEVVSYTKEQMKAMEN